MLITKGANAALDRAGTSPHHVVVGVSWQAPTTTPEPFEVDLSILLCDGTAQVPNQAHIVFASQLKAPTEAPATQVRSHPTAGFPVADSPPAGGSLLDLSGPGTTPAAVPSNLPAGQGPRRDVEEIEVDLTRVPPYVSQIVFALTIAAGGRRRQSFAELHGVSLRVSDLVDGYELARYDLEPGGSEDTSLALAELYRRAGADGTQRWKVRALGQGTTGGLAGLAAAFGVLS